MLFNAWMLIKELLTKRRFQSVGVWNDWHNWGTITVVMQCEVNVLCLVSHSQADLGCFNTLLDCFNRFCIFMSFKSTRGDHRCIGVIDLSGWTREMRDSLRCCHAMRELHASLWRHRDLICAHLPLIQMGFSSFFQLTGLWSTICLSAVNKFWVVRQWQPSQPISATGSTALHGGLEKNTSA